MYYVLGYIAVSKYRAIACFRVVHRYTGIPLNFHKKMCNENCYHYLGYGDKELRTSGVWAVWIMSVHFTGESLVQSTE